MSYSQSPSTFQLRMGIYNQHYVRHNDAIIITITNNALFFSLSTVYITNSSALVASSITFASLFYSTMVEAQLSLSSFKEQFDDQLTCGVCLDQYTDPKALPCQHSFCLKCIQPLPKINKVSHFVKNIIIQLAIYYQ